VFKLCHFLHASICRALCCFERRIPEPAVLARLYSVALQYQMRKLHKITSFARHLSFNSGSFLQIGQQDGSRLPVDKV
jgi:hypothetical protein